jgi:alkanesulfonate monooxygenase SsuD/methylene tetrahydromethanopterin reductase-like flavin-dependent oxidoreductase (luciferase family)
MYVAANGPIALQAAGEYGDGRISAGNEPPPAFRASLEAMQAAATQAGRKLPDDFHTAALTYACVLRPGEDLSSERVVDQVGSMVTSALHYWWELSRKVGTDAFVPQGCRAAWEDYLCYVDAMETPAERRYQQIHDGHCTYLVPAERRFVTPDTIRASGGLVGTPDEIVSQLHELEALGLREVTLLPPMAHARVCFREFAEAVFDRY